MFECCDALHKTVNTIETSDKWKTVPYDKWISV